MIFQWLYVPPKNLKSEKTLIFPRSGFEFYYTTLSVCFLLDSRDTGLRVRYNFMKGMFENDMSKT